MSLNVISVSESDEKRGHCCMGPRFVALAAEFGAPEAFSRLLTTNFVRWTPQRAEPETAGNARRRETD
jgi:hypothetical protein